MDALNDLEFGCNFSQWFCWARFLTVRISPDPILSKMKMLLNLAIADGCQLLSAENGFIVTIKFKFKEVIKWVFEKESSMFGHSLGKAMFGLLVKGELMGLRPFEQSFPVFFLGENQSKMSRINSSLGG